MPLKVVGKEGGHLSEYLPKALLKALLKAFKGRAEDFLESIPKVFLQHLLYEFQRAAPAHGPGPWI